MSYVHRPILVSLLKQGGIDRQTIFTGVEIGIYLGQTSAYLLREFMGMRLLMVDPWMAPQPNTEWHKSLRMWPDQKVMDSQMESAQLNTTFARERRTIIRATSVEAAKQVPDNSLRLGFVDGDHTEPSVMRDLLAWWPKIQVGGLFSGHDYKNPTLGAGVRKAVSEWSSSVGIQVSSTRGGVWFVWKKTGLVER